jgi:hypothetical protein
MAVPSGEQFNRFFRKLDAIPELRGAGVAYVGDRASTVMRPSVHTSGLLTYVILSEVDDDEKIAPIAGTSPPPSLGAELVGLGLNCGSAVLAWSVVVGSTAAVPITGGSSLALTAIVYGATGASTLQCANSILRAVDIGFNDAEWMTALESEEWYGWAGSICDGLALLGVGASASVTLRTVVTIRKASSRSWAEILKGLNRAERKRLTTEQFECRTATHRTVRSKP